jgi:hypothetical protein
MRGHTLRAFLGLAERTDEEILAETDEAETVCAIAPSVWSGMLAMGVKDVALDAIDAAGLPCLSPGGSIGPRPILRRVGFGDGYVEEGGAP